MYSETNNSSAKNTAKKPDTSECFLNVFFYIEWKILFKYLNRIVNYYCHCMFEATWSTANLTGLTGHSDILNIFADFV